MKLLGTVLQNKKGENILLSTSGIVQTKACVLYSKLIFSLILENYRKRLKIERTITLEANLSCVISIAKDYIFYVFVSKQDLSLAFDGVKKFNQFFNSNAKFLSNASSGPGKIEAISKKLVQLMSTLQQFLYTREINFKDYLQIMPQNITKKKHVDFQIFNKFSHMANQADRKLILAITLREADNKLGKKMIKTVQVAQTLLIKIQDELQLLQSDPQKESFMDAYRKSIFKSAFCAKRRNNITTLNYNVSEAYLQAQEDSELNIGLPSSSSIGQPLPPTIKLIKEKLQLHLQNGKIKQVFQFGQVIVEGLKKQKGIIRLLNADRCWNNNKLLSRRISPSSPNVKAISDSILSFQTAQGFKTKPIIDYIIRKETFSQEKIPILFAYHFETKNTKTEFTFKYKINEKWKNSLYNVDIAVCLHRNFIVKDCNAVPTAHSLRNNRMTWKIKEINPNSKNCKGKIVLALGECNMSPKKIIKEIKIQMKAKYELLQHLQAQCEQQQGRVSKGQHALIIEYKIQPNQ